MTAAENKFTRACRTAIIPVIEQFRRKNLIYDESICQLTGTVLTRKDLPQVDHYDMTFAEVVKAWCIEMDFDDSITEYIVYDLICYKSMQVYDYTFYKKSGLAELFIQFHNEHTHLRLVTRRANLTRKKK